MNDAEWRVKEKYEKEGYVVVHIGAPDFLCFKYNKNLGSMTDIIFVEVKDKNHLTKSQWAWRIALETANLEYRVENPHDRHYHKDYYFNSNYTYFKCNNCQHDILIEKGKLLEKLKVMNRLNKKIEKNIYHIDALIEDLRRDKRYNRPKKVSPLDTKLFFERMDNTTSMTQCII
jgi:hypothetical protein